jgi:uncharacterized membrane protein
MKIRWLAKACGSYLVLALVATGIIALYYGGGDMTANVVRDLAFLVWLPSLIVTIVVAVVGEHLSPLVFRASALVSLLLIGLVSLLAEVPVLVITMVMQLIFGAFLRRPLSTEEAAA